jgi:hypothetical protein
MTNPTVGSIDISVLGGPSTINLDVDFGPTGVRGSRIFGVSADPRLSTTPKPIEVMNYDLGIVITPSAPDYLSVYQKTGTSPEDWDAFAALYPNFYADKKTVSFNSQGVGTFTIIASSVFTVPAYLLAMFNVFYQIENSNPISSSMNLSLDQSGNQQVLTVTIKAIEYNGTAWSALQGDKTVHVFSTVV